MLLLVRSYLCDKEVSGADEAHNIQAANLGEQIAPCWYAIHEVAQQVWEACQQADRIHQNLQAAMNFVEPGPKGHPCGVLGAAVATDLGCVLPDSSKRRHTS